MREIADKGFNQTCPPENKNAGATGQLMSERNLKAKVLTACIIDGRPVVPGDTVMVDENTLRNLTLKGRLIASGPAAPAAPSKPAKK